MARSRLTRQLHLGQKWIRLVFGFSNFLSFVYHHMSRDFRKPERSPFDLLHDTVKTGCCWIAVTSHTGIINLGGLRTNTLRTLYQVTIKADISIKTLRLSSPQIIYFFSLTRRGFTFLTTLQDTKDPSNPL
jgi:hypothetical protein